MDTRANVLGTLGSGYKAEDLYGDEPAGTQLSRGYSPDYQSEELEEGEEYDPSSDRFSPSKAYRHYSSKQRAAAPVSTYSAAPRAEVASQPTGYLQLERDLLEEKYFRSQLETQIAELRAEHLQTSHRLEKVEAAFDKTVEKLRVLEGDYRRSLNELQKQGVLHLVKKRRTDDTSSGAPHRTSDAGAST
jgi:hypothetical protein